MLFLAALVAVHCAPAQWQRHGWTHDVTRCQTPSATVDFEPGSLDRKQEEDFARLVDTGIADLRGLLGPAARAPAPRPLRYVVSSRARISTTYGHVVVLPLERVRTHSAPYLHETVHALLHTPNDSTWLGEGLACYLESFTAEHLGGYDAHVFTRAGDRDIHRAARRILDRASGRAVLSFVGRPGDPPGLRADRLHVARPFYVLSESFTKYLVDHLGLPEVVALATSSAPEQELRRSTGRDVTRWREDWQTLLERGG